MSDKKYYVKLKEEFQATGVTFADMRLYLYKSGAFDYGYNGYHFTKSELAEIKDGAFYKKAAYCEFMELPPDWEMRDEKDKWLCEWINPLIELVPVEEEE
ncbi:hypothetical protein [Lactococcus petauri]|jgi:hypothetical protein|uniref:hypothetical protein n=1 Tax=Lactococcus petauri TaxID=1940789 RepID=UPI00254B36FE|nr:hypothetical protein [Lactococcus petauri]